jgi:glutaredoxin
MIAFECWRRRRKGRGGGAGERGFGLDERLRTSGCGAVCNQRHAAFPHDNQACRIRSVFFTVCEHFVKIGGLVADIYFPAVTNRPKPVRWMSSQRVIAELFPEEYRFLSSRPVPPDADADFKEVSSRPLTMGIFSKRKHPAQDSSRLRIVVYTRPGCHLCDVAKKTLAKYALTYEEVNIDDNDDLRRQYTDCVPVVVIDGRERFRGRVDEPLLRRLLNRGDR